MGRYENTAKALTANCKEALKKIKRSRKGVLRTSIPNRTWGALVRHKLVMMNGETVMPTYHGEEVYKLIKESEM